MTVGELKALVPLSDVVELRPDVRYLVRSFNKLTQVQLAGIMEQCRQARLRVVIVDRDFTFYDLGDAAEPKGENPWEGRPE